MVLVCKSWWYLRGFRDSCAAQLFVFALVVTLYFPCIATMGVLGRELGWKSTVTVMTGEITIALAIGAMSFRAITFLQLI